MLVAVAVGALLGRFLLAGSGSSPGPAPPARSGPATPALVAELEARVEADPDQPRLLADLGLAYLDRGRATADPAYLALADRALGRAFDLDGGRVDTLMGRGLLSMARHDFTAALDWAGRATEAAPAAAGPRGLAYDALVELGRYPEAGAALQEMADRRPSLAVHVRVAQFRELHGDRPGAFQALHQARLAGSGSPADRAFVETAMGDLHRAGGSLDEAAAAYDRALGHQPGHHQAEVGLALVEAARGDLAAAATRLATVTARAPSPEWVALLGDVYAAQGRATDAAAQYALVRAIEDLNRANGVAVDLELARFEADHAADPGAEPEVAVALARRAVAARPTVFAHDALGWALRQAGRPHEALPHARAAVALGTADALLWYHLAAAEADAGLAELARQHLTRALDLNRHLTVRDGPSALALAATLGVDRR